MERTISASSNTPWIHQLLRMPERLFVTPLGALAVTLLVPLVVLLG